MTRQSLIAAVCVTAIALSPVTATASDVSSNIAISSNQASVCNDAYEEVAWTQIQLDGERETLEIARANQETSEQEIQELEQSVLTWEKFLEEAKDHEATVADSCKKGEAGRIATVVLAIVGVLGALGMLGYGAYTSGILTNLKI